MSSEFQTQRPDAHQRTVKGGLVEIGGDERRMAVAGFDAEFLERLATHIAQSTFDGDPVAVSVRAGSPPCFWQVRIDAYASRPSPPGPAWMTFISCRSFTPK